MPQLTLADYRTRVSAAVGVDNTASSAEQALIDTFVNEGVEQFIIDTHCKTADASMSLTVNKTEYTLPTQILAVLEMWAISGGQTYPLKRLTATDMVRVQASTGATGGVRLYTVTGHNLLIVWPAPSTGDTLNVYYVPRPATLSGGTDSPTDIPYEYHQAPEFYASWRMAIYDQSAVTANGNLFKGFYQELVSKCRKATRRVGGNRLGAVTPKGNRERWPHDPSLDLAHWG